MKGLLLIIAIVLVAVIVLVACVKKASAKSSAVHSAAERKVAENVPDFVKEAIAKAPEDALIGIGVARMSSMTMSRTTSATRARAEISRQINLVVTEMITEYTLKNKVDPDTVVTFTETITTRFSNSFLSGSSVIEEDMDDKGNYWTVIMMKKENIVTGLNAVQSAAITETPAMASFIPGTNLNEALQSVYGVEIGFRDR